MSIHEHALVPVRTVGAQTQPCIVHKAHSPKQAISQLHHVFPIYLQQKVWPDATREHPHVPLLIPVCGTGHDTIHYFIDLIQAAKDLPGGRWNEKGWAIKAVMMFEKALANPNAV